MLREYAFPSHNTNKNGGVCFGSFVLRVNYNLSVRGEKTTHCTAVLQQNNGAR